MFASGLLALELSTDGAALYPVGDPVVEQTRADRATFLELERVVLLLAARADGPKVASREGFSTLRDLHRSLGLLPGVDRNHVRSLATVMDPNPGETIVEIHDQLDTLPDNPAELADRLRRIADAPHGHGLFLSQDGKAAALYVPLLPDQDRSRFLDQLEAWIATHTPPNFDLQLTGPVVAEVTLGRAVVRDLTRLVPIVVLVIALLLLVALGSVGALLVALAEVGIVLLWTLGAMGWTGTPVTLVTTILPVALLTISVTDEIHLLDRFRAHLAGGLVKVEAISAAMQDVVKPIVLTSLTTAVGLLSFAFTSIVPLRHFGIFAAAGVLTAMLLSFTLVPALVCVLPAWTFAPIGRRRAVSGRPRAPTTFLGLRSAVVAAALVALALPGVLRVEARDSWIDNLEPDSPLVQATHAFDRTFWGSYRYDVVLSADELAYFQFPTGLRVVEQVVALLKAAPHVGGVVSHLDAHEIHAKVDGERLPVSELPLETVRHFSGNLMKIQSRIDLAHYLSADGRSARVRMLVPEADFARTRELEAYLDRKLPHVLAGCGVRFHRSGDLAAAQATVRSVVVNVVRSTGWTILGVAVLLLVALRSLSRALVCLVPLLSGVIVLLGAMGWLEVPLGIATGMFTAVTIGVGVDFGLHTYYAYVQARERGEQHRQALGSTLARAGRAIMWNTAVLAAGLSVLGLSTLPPNRRLGLLLAGAMALCCLMTLLLLPWLLTRVVPGQRSHQS